MSDPGSFEIIYDLRAGGWARANRDRRFWGRLYTDAYVIGPDHLILAFRPAPDERWRAWEEVRRRWILEGAA